MLKEIFLSSIISTSISLKTSNDDSQPHDYEYMISSEKKTDKYSYYIKRDWERELGEKYIDNVINIKYLTDKSIYVGMDLVDNSPKAKQPGAKISEYGKNRFGRQKKASEEETKRDRY